MSFISKALCMSMAAAAGMPLPSVDLRTDGEPPMLATWAHAGGTAAIQVESLKPLALDCDIYQVDGRSVMPLSRDLMLGDIKPGANRVEIPLPETSKRGKLLMKISESAHNEPLANLMVDILPADALDSLVKHSRQGRVWIDPGLGRFRDWAVSRGISSTRPTGGKPVGFHFGKPVGDRDAPPPGGVLIFEREGPDVFPVIEVITSPEVTKILLPPGYLELVPTSATAEALLLKHMHLLP